MTDGRAGSGDGVVSDDPPAGLLPRDPLAGSLRPRRGDVGSPGRGLALLEVRPSQVTEGGAMILGAVLAGLMGGLATAALLLAFGASLLAAGLTAWAVALIVCMLVAIYGITP